MDALLTVNGIHLNLLYAVSLFFPSFKIFIRSSDTTSTIHLVLHRFLTHTSPYDKGHVEYFRVKASCSDELVERSLRTEDFIAIRRDDGMKRLSLP